MTTNQPEPIETRLSRLESVFADMGDVVLAQSDAINALTANVNNLVEQAAADRAQAAQDRQQAAIDRQTWQAEIRTIWEYLLRQSGNGRQG
ncbi:hypothetical protein [Scytonema sp. PCC 10023]|uniref:hypothetical protein n=1 Tax=Scytonema sp. PCC 10023 TaxID=1680591 RepID=UPI0039C5E5EF